MEAPLDQDGPVRCRMHVAEDGEAIADLRWLLKTEDGRYSVPEERHAFIARYRQHLAYCDNRDDTVHWVAERDGALIGVMTVRTVRKEPSPGKPTGQWGYLTNCYVRPERRNRGHGTALLAALLNRARQDGLELLIVWPSERSRSLYRRAGFTGQDDPLELDLTLEG